MPVLSPPYYYVVNVKNYPLENTLPLHRPQDLFEEGRHDHPPPPRRSHKRWRKHFKIERLPRAYIGNSPRRYTFLPFCILLLTAIVSFLAYVIMSVQYLSIITELDIEGGIFSCFILCVLDASAAVIGLKVLSKSIVSPGKLFLLHAIMFIGMLVHMFLPAYEFIPEYRPTNEDSGNRFPVVYWTCHGADDVTEYEEKTAYAGFCTQVLGIGNMFWSTIVLFVVLFIAWRIALCGRPTPIHPEVTTSSELKKRRKTVRRDRLSSIYQTWRESTAAEKPYFAHFPKPNVGLGGVPLNQDDNANIIPITEEDNPIQIQNDHIDYDELTDSKEDEYSEVSSKDDQDSGEDKNKK